MKFEEVLAIKAWLRKQSTAIGSATPDPVKSSDTVAPLPQPVLENKPAPGQTGPRGLAPRTTYSRVNAGLPPPPDAGASAQKSATPRGLELLPAKTAEVQMSASMMTRPTLQDLVKEAMTGTISKVDITTEAVRQMVNQGENQNKEASAQSVQAGHVPTDYVEKLADALSYIATEMEKKADEPSVSPGNGPGALEVTQATSSETNVDAGQQGQATSAHVPPKTPAMESSGVAKDPANAMQTNADMSHPEQPTDPIGNEKGKIGPSEGDKTITASALFTKNLERILKIGQDEEKCPDCKHAKSECTCAKKESSIVDQIRKNFSAGKEKKAEDAINPAQISAGSSDPPAASASESAVPAQPSDVSSQASMVGSNQSAIDYTKGQAKADPKKDLGKVLSEPALSSATDKTLEQAFDNTGNAGVKISSVQNIAGDMHKVAAARALLSKLAQDVSGEKKEEPKPDAKKEKSSMLTPTPQGHSGFNASSMGGGSM